MLYRHPHRRLLIRASFIARESGSVIVKELKILKKKYRFTGVVSDGGIGIGNAILDEFGNIPPQICLVHLHRDVVNAIGRFPKDEKVKQLKKIADYV
ncbi:hypothetical protein M1271_04365 [Patescibacteria group bacterium]|nr:hypothetical protein [Patescibacteria group bacterium]